MWPSSRPHFTLLLHLYPDFLMISLKWNPSVGQVGPHIHSEISSVTGLRWIQSSINLKWTVGLSWLLNRTLHRPDIQLMVCYLNSVPGIHFMLQWTRCWAAVQTLLCPAVKHLQLWSLIDTKPFTAGYRCRHNVDLFGAEGTSDPKKGKNI